MNDDLESDLDFKPKKASAVLPWSLFVLLLIGAGAGLYWMYGSLSSEQDKSAAAEKASADAAARLKALEADNAKLQSAKGALEGEVKDKDAELAKLKATYDSLQDKMKDEIKKGEISLTQVGGRIQVGMVDKILFDSGHAEFSKRGQEVLMRVGAVLATVEDKQIQVSGHTDDSPPSERLISKFPTNWELSCSRAINVVRFLSEKANVPSKRLLAAGYGQFHPISGNATPEGRARNRRIEILLTPALDAKPTTLAAAEVKPAKVANNVKPAVAKKSVSKKKKH